MSARSVHISALLSLCLIAVSGVEETLAANIALCGSGFSSSSPTQGLASPQSSFQTSARGELQCLIKCLQQQAACLQLYYSKSSGTCSIIQSSYPLSSLGMDIGSLITVPNPQAALVKSCDNVQCPSGTICMTDCSTSPWQPMCVADNSQCSQGTEVVNVKKYYTSTFEDNTDVGVVQNATYIKTNGNSAIRVQWYASTSAHRLVKGYCSRYYVTFNGAECNNPNTIDFVDYDESINDNRQYSEIDGMCYGLPSGPLVIAINIGPCASYNVSDSFTGYQSARSMWIWEVVPAPTTGLSTCTALSSFNTAYATIKDLANITYPDAAIMSMNYMKVASDTALRIKWLGVTGVDGVNSSRCARWYVTVNGSECTNPRAEFIVSILTNASSAAKAAQMTRTLEGICYNLTSGFYVIELRVGTCKFPVTILAVARTGWFKSISRFIVNEVRIASKATAVRNSNGQLARIPFFNLGHWSWYSLSLNVSVPTTLLSVTYQKWSDTSGLRLRFFGDARPCGPGACCRWYFSIDGSECSNPGPIEGVAYMLASYDFHRPGAVDGVCNGILSGSHTIKYNVGPCLSSTIKDCHTGSSGSTMHIMVDEVQPDYEVACASPLACP